jgi:hypothetical protein
MKEKSKILKAAMATIFASLNSKNQEKGINLQFKYDSKPVEEVLDEEGNVINPSGWKFDIIIGELGHKDRTVQSFLFQRPNNIDRYNMEYNVYMSVISALTESSLLMWDHLGKQLNVDKELQKAALNSLKDGEENITSTDG